MPGTPNRPCNHCNKLCKSGLCPDCQKKQDEIQKQARRKNDNRPSAYRRGYGPPWEKVALMQLARVPLCQDCQAKGKKKNAEVVHHIIEIEKRWDLRFDFNNLMSLCRDCHEIRHGRKADPTARKPCPPCL